MEQINYNLIEIANQLNRYTIPMIILIGIISNSLNIVILTRRTLSQHACSLYFIAHAASNLFYITIVLIYRLLADQYNIDPAKSSLFLCKLIIYISHIGVFLAPNFLVLASIDRWCASSTNVHLRKFSHVKIARWIILVTIIFFMIFFINSAVLVDLRIDDPFGCRIRADTIYKQVYVFIQSCLISLIQPLLMLIFGLMTIYNIKKVSIQPAQMSSDRRTGRQLSLMLIVQVMSHVLLNGPISIGYIIFTLPNEMKFRSEFIFVIMISFLPFHFSYTTAFFLYILSSNIYRREFIRLINHLFVGRRHAQVRPFLTQTT